MSGDAIRIVLADDHAVVREGIRAILEDAEQFEVVAEAADGAGATALVETHAPDVLVLDISMPGRSGVEVIRALRRSGYDAGILVLSMHDHAEYVLEAMRAGADGYILKSAGPADLRSAVRAVANRQAFLDASVVRHVGAALRDERGPAPINLLTPREREVLARIASGRTSREIGAELGISTRTVETHRERLMRKLEIHSIAGLTRFALEAGLIDARAPGLRTSTDATR